MQIVIDDDDDDEDEEKNDKDRDALWPGSRVSVQWILAVLIYLKCRIFFIGVFPTRLSFCRFCILAKQESGKVLYMEHRLL